MEIQINISEKTGITGKFDTQINIIDKLRAGDPKAWEKTLQQNNQFLFRLARSIVKNDIEAEDVVQETYVRAYLKLSDFRGPTGFRSWLARIATNEALMRLRRNRNWQSLEELEETSTSVPQNAQINNDLTPENQAMKKELTTIIENAVDTLPLDFRPVFILRNIQQLSTRETAECLDIPEATVKTRLHRASKLMRSQINQQLDMAESKAFEFAGSRCARITKRTLARILEQRIKLN